MKVRCLVNCCYEPIQPQTIMSGLLFGATDLRKKNKKSGFQEGSSCARGLLTWKSEENGFNYSVT